MSTTPYRPMDGIGVYFPLKQVPTKSSLGNGALNSKSSARLYKRSGQKPKAYATAIKANPKAGQIVASFFSQYGR